MDSFCYPTTKKLDPDAVQEAHDYLENLRNEGKIPGRDAPLPVGRYLPILVEGIGEPFSNSKQSGEFTNPANSSEIKESSVQ